MEIILINQDSVMITESKFAVNAPLKKKANTEPVRQCAHSEEISGEWLDYRQVSVFGASMCFANGWTLVAKIDKSEVLESLGDYLQQNLLSGSATLLLILLMMYIFSIGIVAPLQELESTARKIGQGDAAARVALTTRDEFGQVGLAFNEMAERIQQFQLGMRQKIQAEEVNRQAISNILDDLAAAKKQAEEKLLEVERLNKVMIDRELKMIELKATIKELKKHV